MFIQGTFFSLSCLFIVSLSVKCQKWNIARNRFWTIVFEKIGVFTIARFNQYKSIEYLSAWYIIIHIVKYACKLSLVTGNYPSPLVDFSFAIICDAYLFVSVVIIVKKSSFITSLKTHRGVGLNSNRWKTKPLIAGCSVNHIMFGIFSLFSHFHSAILSYESD